MLPVLLAALLVAGWFAWKRNARFDLLDWALVAYATAWLLAGLAAPWNFPSALREALILVAGALFCLCLRSALPARSRVRARAAAVAVVAGVLSVLVAPPPSGPVPRSDLAAASRLAFSQQAVFGWGPGQFREWTPRWLARSRNGSPGFGLPPELRPVAADPPGLYLHHLADGGVVAAGALAFLVLTALAMLVPRVSGRRADAAARVGLAALVLWLLWGFVSSALLQPGPMLAFWVALGRASGKQR